MNIPKKSILLGTAFALSLGQVGVGAPAAAQSILGDVLKIKDGKIKLDLEVLVGLLFGTKKEATEKGTCQLDVDAQALVDKDIYGNKYGSAESDRLYCNNFKIKGLKADESRQVAEQFLAVRNASSAVSGSGVANIKDKKGRMKQVPFSWNDGELVNSTEILTVIDGVTVPEQVRATSPSRSFRKITVRKGSHLNLRSGASIEDKITGIYKGGNIVLVKAFFDLQPDRKCKSGRWALLQNNGTGIGYVCSNYLGDAPASTTISQVDSFQKPPKVFVKPSSGYTLTKEFQTKRRRTALTVKVKGRDVIKSLGVSSNGLRSVTNAKTDD